MSSAVTEISRADVDRPDSESLVLPSWALVSELSVSAQSFSIMNDLAEPLTAVLVAVDEAGDVLTGLTVRFTTRVRTGSLAILTGSDESGSMTLRAGIEAAQLHVKFSWLPSGQTPAELVPVIQLLHVLHRPNRLGVMLGGRLVGEPFAVRSAPEIPSSLLGHTRALAFVQSVTGVEFAMPDELSSEDVRDLTDVTALLRGERVRSRWKEARVLLRFFDATVESAVTQVDEARIEVVAPATFTIAGHRISVGEVRQVIETAVLGNLEELRQMAAASSSEELVARFVPGSSDFYELRLVDPPASSLADPYASLVTLDSEVLDRARSKPSSLGRSQTA